MADVTSLVVFASGGALALSGVYSWYRGSQLQADADRKTKKASANRATESGRLQELESQLSVRERSASDFKRELEETGKRLREAEAHAESVTADMARQIAKVKALEEASAERERAERDLKMARTELTSTGAQLAEARGKQAELEGNLETTTAQIAALRSRLRETEQRANDAESNANVSDERAEKRLAKLTALSEQQALELQKAREALAASLATESRTPAGASANNGLLAQALLGASRDAIAVLDESGVVVSWNRSAESIYGYGAAEAVGLSAPLLIAHDSRDTFNRTLEHLHGADADRPRRLDIFGMRKDGSVFPTEVLLARWDEGGETRYVLIAHDVSERRQAEAMRRDKEAAEEANRAKSQFLANMSHELRTPLNAIIGFSEILYDRTFGDLTSKQERYVSNILSSGRHLLQLINDILDLSKIEAGRVQIEYAAFAPLTAVRTVDNLVKALLSKKNIMLEIDAPNNLPPLIADQSKFKQILYNLLSNAIKFTPENGKVGVTLSTAAGGSLLQVSVTDTGIGIKPEDQERIFKEFEQVDSSYARQQQGTGLGLALVRKFVFMHGGRIWVTSEGEGKGSTFTFTIPFAPADEDIERSRATAVEAPVVEVSNGPKPMVLVVDDDPSAGELLTLHLQEGGYDVARAANAADALQMAQTLSPQVITLDVELPDRLGWDVLADLKANQITRLIPTIMISVTKERTRAMQAGAAEFLVKPVERQSLLRTLADVRDISAIRAAENASESPGEDAPETAAKPATEPAAGSGRNRRRGRGEQAAA